MKSRLIVFAMTVSISLVISGCSTAPHATKVRVESPLPSSPLAEANLKRLDPAIHSAAAMLRSLILPDGQFVYRFKIKDDLEKSNSYNIIRHAGAIYSLAMYEADFPNQKTRDAIRSTSAFLISSSLRDVPDARGVKVQAIFSDPELTHKGHVAEAALGGTALGLVALVEADRVNPDVAHLATLRALGEFLLSMQMPNGSFYSKYLPGEPKEERFQSLYYPGEAILALTLLGERDPDPKWVAGAINGLRFLANSRRGQTDIPSDNWALVATQEIFKQKQLSNENRALFLDHAVQVSKRNISDQTTDPQSPLFGCYTRDGRTTPTATHLEGLLAAFTYLPETVGPLRQAVSASIDGGIAFLLDSQLKEGRYTGAIPMANLEVLKKLKLEDNKNATAVRIDYIQHALSAFLRYRLLHPLPI